MMPGVYNFNLYEGATFVETWTRSGVTTATGWSARLDIREKADEGSTLYQTLTSSDGIVLTSNGSVLSMVVTITAARAATIQAAAQALGNGQAFYDLKLTKPDATIEYLLRGSVQLTRRTTP